MTTQGSQPTNGATTRSVVMDNPELRAEIKTVIRQAALAYFQKAQPTLTPEAQEQLAEQETGAYELGIYLINQNPYAEVGDLILPQLPPDQDSEMRRVRKSGVLRDYHSGNRLPTNEAIPAGQIVDFTYENRASLEDTDAGSQSPGADIDATDDVDVYHHNVVKFVRFRYTVTTRNNAKAWLLCCFSGGDA